MGKVMTGEDSNFDSVQQGMQEQPLENLGKPMIFAQVEYDVVTCQWLNCICINNVIGHLFLRHGLWSLTQSN